MLVANNFKNKFLILIGTLFQVNNFNFQFDLKEFKQYIYIYLYIFNKIIEADSNCSYYPNYPNKNTVSSTK